MSDVEVLEIVRESVWLMLKIAGPVMLAGLAVGFVISLFQALTQIQEVTLVFVPKIVVTFGAIVLLLPIMIAIMSDFFLEIAARISAM